MNKTFNRDFGILIGVVILLFFAREYYLNSNINYYLFFGSIGVFIISFVRPRWFSLFSFVWFKFGTLLSFVLSPIILFSIFFFLITPMSLIFKILKKDLLKTNFLISTKTNWINRERQPKSMNKQF